MELKPLKVSEVNNYISRVINNDVLLYNISIEGEVSNCKYHSNGHVYLSLKDDKSRIKGIIFAQYVPDIDFIIEDGMNITASGYIDFYKRDGTCQIVIKNVRETGKGKLYEEFERLKKKLSEEGLFDDSFKKPIPMNPKTVGIVTSLTGAAVRDLVTNIRRRNILTDIIIAPALVQGSGAEDSISEAVRKLDMRKPDLMIVGRGGGSIEDLMAFNSEKVARAIFSAETPVISAVGHETDFTIVDFVSDRRASTPSTAAEIAVMRLGDIYTVLENMHEAMKLSVEMKLDNRASRLENAMLSLKASSPEMKLQNSEDRLENRFRDLKRAFEDRIYQRENQLRKAAAELEALSPLKTLARGYSIVENADKDVISSADEVSEGENVTILFSEGAAEAEIKEKISGKSR